jgi:hypothetical protein
MEPNWAEQEMAGAKVHDPRCARSLVRICGRLAQHAGASFSAACGPAARQAARRIYGEPSTKVKELLAGHRVETAARCQEQAWVLVAQDTTSFNYTAHPATVDLGPINQYASARGLLAHSALAISPAGVPLGLLHLEIWARSVADHGTKRRRQRRAIPDKESAKWLAGLRAVEEALPAALPVLLVQDREADVFPLLAARRRANLELLVRAHVPRAVEVSGDPRGAAKPTTLQVAAAGAPRVGQLTVKVARQRGRPEREAQLEVRARGLRVLPPRHQRARGPEEPWDPPALWVIWASEPSPPEGEEAVDWVLVTTVALRDDAHAVRMVGYYALRWRIERLHFTLKSGCRVEQLQMETAHSLKNVLALYYVVAWRLLWLTYVARAEPDQPAAELLAPREVAVLAQATGTPVATAQQAVRAIGQLGGFQGYRSAREPGVKSLWQGLRRLEAMVWGWQLAIDTLSTVRQA